MKKILIFLLFFVCALPAFGQSAQGNITAASTNCSVANSCVTLNLLNTAGGASITLTGTFSATLQFEVSGDNGVTWAAASTASSTAVGVTNISVAGYTNLRVRCSTYVSGTVNATLYSGAGSIRSGSGGGISQVSSLPASCTPSTTAPVQLTVAPFGLYICTATNVWTTDLAFGGNSVNGGSFGILANWRVTAVGSEFTVTSGSAIVTCTTCAFTAADVGKQIFATTWAGNDVTYGTAVRAVPATVTTIFSFQSATQVTMSQNAVANAGTTNTNNGALAYGTDDTAAWHAAKVAAYDGFNCLSLIVPGGITNLNNAEFNSAACHGISGGSTLSKYPAVIGLAGANATVLLPPWFNATNCTGGLSTTGCITVGSFYGLNFNGLGQSTINIGAKHIFETSNDAEYYDLSFWGFDGGTGNLSVGFTINNGYHTAYDIVVDGFGSSCVNVVGDAHVVQAMFSGNCANTSSGAVTLLGGAILGCTGCAYFGGGSGVMVLMNASSFLWDWNSVYFESTLSSCLKLTGGGNRAYLYGALCQNNGNASSNSFVVQSTGFLKVQDSLLASGASATVWVCSATAGCIDGGGNSYTGGGYGLAPTVTGTIAGTTPTITLAAGINSPNQGIVTITEGTGTPTTGTFVLTFNQTFSQTPVAANPPACLLTFQNGTFTLNARISGVVTTAASTAMTWTIDNNAATITAAATWSVEWQCTPR